MPPTKSSTSTTSPDLPLAPAQPLAMGTTSPTLPTASPPAASHTAPIVTLSGLTMVSGSVPDNSERNMRACRAPTCRETAVKQCARRYCAKCCSALPLRDGERCSIHKGTTPPTVSTTPKTSKTARAKRTSDEEDSFNNDDDDDPLDVSLSYSRNLQREWQQQWVAADLQALTDVNFRSAGRRSLIKEHHYMTILVWHKDGELPEQMDVLVPNWPFFHPNDLPSLAKEILMVDDLYWRYDEGGSCWIKTNRQLRVDTGLTLYTRAIGVTSCPNLPGSTPMITPSTPTKRRATPDSAFDRSPSPAKLFRTTSSSSVGDGISRNFSTPSSADAGLSAMHLLNLATRTPSHSPSRRTSLHIVNTAPLPRPAFDASMSTPSSRYSHPPRLDASVVTPLPPLPSAYPLDFISTMNRTAPSSPSLPLDANMFISTRSTPTRSDHQAHATTSTTLPSTLPICTAEPNSHTYVQVSSETREHTPTDAVKPHPLPQHVDTTFPLEYACDMLSAFRALYADKRGSIETRFTKHFNVPWSRNAFYEARTVWKEVDPKVAAVFESAGRSEAGRWSSMVQHSRQSRRPAPTQPAATVPCTPTTSDHT